jgi:hypothetical protein
MVNQVYLLIGVVMSIIGVFTLWGSTLVKERLGGAENVTPITVCQSAMFNFYSGKYDRGTKNLYLVLENQRSVEIRLNRLYLFYPNNMVTFELNKTLEGNILKSVSINGIEDGFASGTVKTNCPDVSADFGYSQLIVSGEKVAEQTVKRSRTR